MDHSFPNWVSQFAFSAFAAGKGSRQVVGVSDLAAFRLQWDQQTSDKIPGK